MALSGGAAGVAMALCLVIWAGTGRADPAAGGDVALGEYLSQDCVGCHREHGAGAGIPVLAGRPAAEVIAAMQDFRDGQRPDPIMQMMARRLSEDEIAALAAYYQGLGK